MPTRRVNLSKCGCNNLTCRERDSQLEQDKVNNNAAFEMYLRERLAADKAENAHVVAEAEAILEAASSVPA
jgi:hypothetical protein